MFWVFAFFIVVGSILFAREMKMAIEFEEFYDGDRPGPLRPSRNHRSGNVTLERAHEICRIAAWHREQMEGELAELCSMFGVGIDDDCDIRDWCMQIVYDGTMTLDQCINLVAKKQRKSRRSKS
jgi:hypothetical protein